MLQIQGLPCAKKEKRLRALKVMIRVVMGGEEEVDEVHEIQMPQCPSFSVFF